MAAVTTITGAVNHALGEYEARQERSQYMSARDFLAVLADHGYAVVPIITEEGNTNGQAT